MNLCSYSVLSLETTDVETTEQFILMHTRYVCDFTGLANFSQKLCKLENIYIVFCFLLRFSCFWPTMNSLMPSKQRRFASRLIRKVNYPKKLFPWPSVCLLASVKVQESCELLHLREVLNFFLCFRSELATEIVLNGAIRLDSKIRCVQRRKWFPTANGPQTGNDPQIGLQMILNHRWSPMWTANDPTGKRGIAWSLFLWSRFQFLT